MLLAYYPQPDNDARDVAKKILAVCLSKETSIDWDEVERLAGLDAFNIRAELAALKEEVANELGDRA